MLLALVLLSSLSFSCSLVADEEGKLATLASPRADLSTLKFLHIVWRHGDRTPSRTIPSDTANPLTTWDPPAKSELTKLGAEQHFRLGKFIRQRYDGFLPRDYSPAVVKIRRTDYNRTLWSARADLAGMFNPQLPTFKSYSVSGRNGGEFVMECEDKEHDRLLSDAYEACPRVPEEEKAQYTTAEFKRLEAENEPVLRYLGEKSGFGTIPLPLKDIYRLFDPINSEVAHPENHVLPPWANETIRAEIQRLYDAKNRFEYNTKLSTRLQAGLLFQDILNRMKSVSANALPQQKVQIYSAHDISIEGILVIMGVHTCVYPRFATAVFIELHDGSKTPSGKDFVRIFHRNVTGSDLLWEYPIGDCPKECTLDVLEQAKKDYLPVNLDEECKVNAGSVVGTVNNTAASDAPSPGGAYPLPPTPAVAYRQRRSTNVWMVPAGMALFGVL